MRRSQAALEFLLTYGWSILVALVVIGALAYFGVLNPYMLVPEKCTLATGINCEDYHIEEGRGIIKLQNGMGADINILSVGIEGCGCASSGIIKNGESETFEMGLCDFEKGQKTKRDVNIIYSVNDGFEHIIQGQILAKPSSSTGMDMCGGSLGPLDEEASQSTATIDGSGRNIVLNLINGEAFDIYLKSFQIIWDDPSVDLDHILHRTPPTAPNNRIWPDGGVGAAGESSPVTDVFYGTPGELIVEASGYSILEEIHFDSPIPPGTTFTIRLDFEDVSSNPLGSSTLTFTT